MTRPRSRRPAAHPERSPATASTTSSGTTPTIIRGLDAKPIVIGHSFGGLIAQRLLGEDLAAAAVAIDPAPIKGVLILPLSALRVASIALLNPANKKRAVALTAEQFRYGFGNAISAAESAELYERWTIPSPGKPLFEAASANFSPRSPAKVNTANASRGPLLLTAGGKDHTFRRRSEVDAQAVQQVAAVTDYKVPDRGHSLALDSGWQESPTSCWPGSRSARPSWASSRAARTRSRGSAV